MMEIKKEIGFKFCDNSQILYASKAKDYLFFHPEIIDSEIEKIRRFSPGNCGPYISHRGVVTNGNLLILRFNDYLHTILTVSGEIIGKDLKYQNGRNSFELYANEDMQIVISRTGKYFVVKNPKQKISFLTCDCFEIYQEMEDHNFRIIKLYDRNCNLLWADYGSNRDGEHEILEQYRKEDYRRPSGKDCLNLYRQHLLEYEQQLLDQKINRVLDLKNANILKGTFIDSIRMNEGKTNLYFQSIEELENLTESYKRERIKKEDE